MTRLFVLIAAGILGPILFAFFVAWLINRPRPIRRWVSGHRFREVERPPVLPSSHVSPSSVAKRVAMAMTDDDPSPEISLWLAHAARTAARLVGLVLLAIFVAICVLTLGPPLALYAAINRRYGRKRPPAP
jgi:hypothetical protein